MFLSLGDLQEIITLRLVPLRPKSSMLLHIRDGFKLGWIFLGVVAGYLDKAMKLWVP
jgi:hypothetical protein